MKKHITQAALDAAAREWKTASAAHRRAESVAQYEYFFGKMVGLVEAVALLTDQGWVEAEAMLRSRAKGD